MSAAVLPAHADDGEYYIEIGHEASRADAAKEWQALQSAHKRQLGHLQYYPKEVIHENAPPTTRIQAGPIKDRAVAEKTCTRLFKANVPCFVLEGLTRAPVSVISLAQSIQQKPEESSLLPWIKPAPRVVPPPPEPARPTPAKETAAEAPPKVKPLPPLPWLVQQQKPAKPGEVKVAEAVRVPVSEESENQSVTVHALPAPEIAATEGVSMNVAERPQTDSSGWLSVSAFLDQEAAQEFWDNVRTGLPHEQAETLHGRITGPAYPGTAPGTVLAVGPFATRDAAYNFCTNLIQSRDSDLRCLFETNQPVKANKNAPVESTEHSEEYDARRQHTEAARRYIAQASELPQPTGKSMQLYWLQLLAAPSEMDALNQWNDIKTANADLLGNMRSSVIDTMQDGNEVYVVRLGPLTGEGDARKLCDALSGRGTACRVLQYSSH